MSSRFYNLQSIRSVGGNFQDMEMVENAQYTGENAHILMSTMIHLLQEEHKETRAYYTK